MLRNNNNILLQKDDVGMPKPTVRMLPDFGHSYGLPGARDAEGVKSCKYLTYRNFFYFCLSFTKFIFSIQ